MGLKVELVQAVDENMQLIIFGIVGVLILFLILRLFKLPLKILLNGVFGVILLYGVNFIAAKLGYPNLIGINVLNALVAGILGIPGVAVLIIIKLFI